MRPKSTRWGKQAPRSVPPAGRLPDRSVDDDSARQRSRLRSRSDRCCGRLHRIGADRDRFKPIVRRRLGFHWRRRNRLDHFAPAMGAPCLDPLMLTLEHRWNRLELFDVTHSVLRHHELEPETIRVPTGVGQHPIGTAPEHVTHDRHIGGADGRQQTVLLSAG